MAVLTHIGWAYGAVDIGLVRAAFDAAEVPVFVLGDAVHQMMGHQAIAMGGARICVLDHDAQQGSEILEICQLTHPARVGWGIAVSLLVLSVVFGAVPLPYRAVFVREAAQVTGDAQRPTRFAPPAPR